MAWTIPPETKYSFRRGSSGIVVFAIQRNLTAIGSGLLDDGEYGGRTERRVRKFQVDEGLFVDGILGPECSRRMAQKLEGTVAVKLPARLIEGFVEGESTGHVGTVNWSVPGGVDVSYLQRRVLDDADDATIERAFDGRYQFSLVARTTRDRYKAFLARASLHSSQIAYITDKRERSWRLAALAHNWPYASDRLSRGYSLSDDLASWVPDNVTFEDGTPVETYIQWAKFYALGAPEHQHRGMVTQFVTDWTP